MKSKVQDPKKGKRANTGLTPAKTETEKTLKFQGKDAIPDILAFISHGQSLRKACEAMNVKAPTFLLWVSQNPNLAEQYAHAREIGLEVMAEEILEIADDGSMDVTVDPQTGKVSVDHEAVQRARLRVDTRKWLLSKLHAKKYGDKLDVTTGGNPIPVPVIQLAHGKPEHKAD
jgi:hypothetical protein